jgi:transcription elongation factor GreA
MGAERRIDHRAVMTESQAINSPTERVPADVALHPATRLTAADYDAVVRELDAMRSRHRVELERRLRDARAVGSSADDDDVLDVFEAIAVEEARIAQLEALLRSASIVDSRAAFDGRAGLGCTVRVAGKDGRATDYLLVGRRHSGSEPHEVSSASPVGMALLGARAGDVVDFVLPNGRRRSLEILAVEMRSAEARAA